MLRIISEIQNNLSLDNIKYFPNFDYNKSCYANMTFPEIGNIDLFNIVPAPYKNSSDETLREIKLLSTKTQQRTKEEIRLAEDVDENPLLLFYPVIQELKLNFNQRLFNDIYYNCLSAVIDHLKYYYNRARPFQIAKALNIHIDRIITKTHHTPSYPSGHTMYACLASEILISDYPQHKSKLDQLTSQAGLARVLQGVHYPSDNTAAIKIVKTIFPNLKKYFTGERL